MNDEAVLPEHVSVLNRRLERLAEQGDWRDLEAVLCQRDALLARVNAPDREHALVEARRSTERVAALARAAQAACRAEILSLRQGRDAATRYGTVRQD